MNGLTIYVRSLYFSCTEGHPNMETAKLQPVWECPVAKNTRELSANRIQGINLMNQCFKLAVVGDNIITTLPLPPLIFFSEEEGFVSFSPVIPHHLYLGSYLTIEL